MPSPFPGMDPYLERPVSWPGLHALLISTSALSLGPKLAPGYYVAVEERVYVETLEPQSIVGRPDAAVIGEARDPAAPYGGTASIVFERPMTVELPLLDEIHQRYLEIREAATHQVITVIEILSPSNKQPGEGRHEYEEKRLKVLKGMTNLVEIDLLCQGKPMAMEPVPKSHYRMLVSRGWERPRAKLYPFNLNEPIPEIPIPLRKGEAEPSLQLGELLKQVYDQARYDLRINYAAEPEPPLEPDWANWARQMVTRAT